MAAKFFYSVKRKTLNIMLFFNYFVCTFLTGHYCLILTLVNKDILNGIYLFTGQMLAVDPYWVHKYATRISDFGHIAACFVLTSLAFPVFKRRFLAVFFAVAGLAVCGELLQLFLPTRQAKFEDLVFSLTGIVLAFIMNFFLRRIFAVNSIDK